MFCFGVVENKSQDGKNSVSHSVSCQLWNKDGATENQLTASKLVENIIQKCKEHILEVKSEIRRPRLTMSHLDDLDKLLYWSTDDKGDRIPNKSPTITFKLMEYKESIDKNGNVKPHQISSIFYLENEVDDNGNPVEVDPLEFLSDKNHRKCATITPAVKIDNIFIGKSMAIQCKIYEADISPQQSGQQRLLHSTNNTPLKKPKLEVSSHMDTTNELQ